MRLLLFLLLLLPAMVSAQIKVRKPTEAWVEMQSDYTFDDRSYLFFRNEYRHNTDPAANDASDTSPFNNFFYIEFRGGYENIFNDHWSGGGTAGYNIQNDHCYFLLQPYLRHTGSIGSLRFMKRLSFEHQIVQGGPNEGEFQLRVEVDKIIELSHEMVIRPRINYDLYTFTSFGQDSGDLDGRTIDRTRLRLDLTFEANRHIFISSYFTRQTDFYVLEPQFDQQGNIFRPGGKHNFITPILGFDIRFNLYQSRKAVSSRHR